MAGIFGVMGKLFTALDKASSGDSTASSQTASSTSFPTLSAGKLDGLSLVALGALALTSIHTEDEPDEGLEAKDGHKLDDFLKKIENANKDDGKATDASRRVAGGEMRYADLDKTWHVARAAEKKAEENKDPDAAKDARITKVLVGKIKWWMRETGNEKLTLTKGDLEKVIKANDADGRMTIKCGNNFGEPLGWKLKEKE